MALRLLDAGVRSRLRSGVAITSMAQCVEELTENGIDAGATCIAVRVDIDRYKLQVVDNGKGISSEELNLVGERYCTSKCHTVADLEDLQYFGFRGEGLASVAEVCGTVEVCSRHRLSQQTYSKVFHKGKAISIVMNESTRSSIGTTVTVHDFFYNLPVRRKGITKALELERIRKVLEALALVNLQKSFSLRDDETGELILQTHKTSSIVTNFGHLFGSDKSLNMKVVSAIHGCFKVSGYVSTEGHHNKSMQFVYVNGRIVKKTALHTCINSLLANSVIGRKISRQGDSKSNELLQDKEFLSPKRVPDRYGIYILMIECPRDEYDICLEPSKTLIEFRQWEEVLLAVETAVRRHLVEHSLTLGPVIVPDKFCRERAIEDTANSSFISHPVSSCSTTTVQSLISAVQSRELAGGEAQFDLDCRSMVQSKTVRRNKRENPSHEEVLDDEFDQQHTKKARMDTQPCHPASEDNADLLPPQGNTNCYRGSEELPTIAMGKAAEHSSTGAETLGPDTSESCPSSCLDTLDAVGGLSTLPVPPRMPASGIFAHSNHPRLDHHPVPVTTHADLEEGVRYYFEPSVLSPANNQNPGHCSNPSSLVQQDSYNATSLHTFPDNQQALQRLYSLSQNTASAAHGDAIPFGSARTAFAPAVTVSQTAQLAPCSQQSTAAYATVYPPISGTGYSGEVARGDTLLLQHPLFTQSSSKVSSSADTSQPTCTRAIGSQSKLQVTLNTPLRSPLQTGSLSSKLAKLIRKSKTAAVVCKDKPGCLGTTHRESESSQTPRNVGQKSASTQAAPSCSKPLLQSVPVSMMVNATSNATCDSLQFLPQISSSYASQHNCLEASGVARSSTYPEIGCCYETASSSNLLVKTSSFSGSTAICSTKRYENTSNHRLLHEQCTNPCISLNPWCQPTVSSAELSTDAHKTSTVATGVVNSTDKHVFPECLPTRDYGTQQTASKVACTTMPAKPSYSVKEADTFRATRPCLPASRFLFTTQLPTYDDSLISSRRPPASMRVEKLINRRSAKVDTSQPPCRLPIPDYLDESVIGDSSVLQGDRKDADREIPSDVHPTPHTASDRVHQTMSPQASSQNAYLMQDVRQSPLFSSTPQEAAPDLRRNPSHYTQFLHSDMATARGETLASTANAVACAPHLSSAWYHQPGVCTATTQGLLPLVSQVSCCTQPLPASEVVTTLPELGRYQEMGSPSVSTQVMYCESLVGGLDSQDGGATIEGPAEGHPLLSPSRPLEYTNGSCCSMVGHRPLWKAVRDPATGRNVFIHSITGMSSSEKPPTESTLETATLKDSGFSSMIDDTNLSEDSTSRAVSQLAGDMECSLSSGTTFHSSFSTSSPAGSTLGAAPLRAAPHLSHDFDPLMPRPKHLRTKFDNSSNSALSSNDVAASTTVHVSRLASSLDEVVGESKWRSSGELRQLRDSQPENDYCSLEKLLETWENPTFKPGHEEVLNMGMPAARRGEIRVHSVIQQYKFSKEMFRNLKVLGQVDDKFIACLMDSKATGQHDLLVLIDQHAAHERVRLEKLIADLYEDPASARGSPPSSSLAPPSIKSSVMQPPLSITLLPSERRLARLFRRQLGAIGVSLVFHGESVQVTGIPSVFMVREASELRRGRPTVALDIVQELIVKQLEVLQATAGGSSSIPSTVTHVLNSQACHGAIKFGDPLSQEECQSLIQQLSMCKLPFQCAHGRPSLVPILDLNILRKRYPTQGLPFPLLGSLKKRKLQTLATTEV